MNFQDWTLVYSQGATVWYAKRLSANDTQASGGHQAGPYITRNFVLDVFPSMDRHNAVNPEKWFGLHIDSHRESILARAIWYNQGTRNEARITNLGGVESVLLNPASTGALAIFAFPNGRGHENYNCHAWVCNPYQEGIVERLVGTIMPAQGRVVRSFRL